MENNEAEETIVAAVSQETPILGLFSLIMITIGAVAVDSIRNLSNAALFGSSLIFLFLFAALFFLVPSTLISAELVTAWPECGGIYVWVKHAFGKRMGFVAIWLQWIENVVWFPVILYFAVSSALYLISPELANNKTAITCSIIGSFWLITIVNLLGVKQSTHVSNLCTVFGILLPMAIIIGLGICWVISGHATQIHFSPQNVIPKTNEPQFWVALTGIMLSYCGIEIATAHANKVHRPHRNFPRAFLISTVVLLITLICGALVIAAIIPGNKIDIVSGIMQTFDALFSTKFRWIMPFVTLALILGVFGGINSWIMGPTRGLFVAACDGHLPKHFQKKNRHDTPSMLLFYQAIVVSIIVLGFWIFPCISDSYWLLTVLAAQLYMLMYMLMFASAIYLRYKHPDKKRPFLVPGGKIGIIIIGGIGITGAFLTLIASFIPPHHVAIGKSGYYEILLAIGLFILVSPAFIRGALSWKKDKKTSINNPTTTSK